MLRMYGKKIFVSPPQKVHLGIKQLGIIFSINLSIHVADRAHHFRRSVRAKLAVEYKYGVILHGGVLVLARHRFKELRVKRDGIHTMDGAFDVTSFVLVVVPAIDD